MTSANPLKLVRPPQAIASVVEINQADLQGEAAKLPSDILYWGWNAAAAAGRVAQARMARDMALIRARDAAAIRVEQETAEGTRPKGRGQAPGGLTVDAFESIVQGDEDVRMGVADLRAAEDDEARIGAVVAALRQKGESLMSLGAYERKAQGVGMRQS